MKKLARNKSVAATMTFAAVAVIALMLGGFAVGVAQLSQSLAEKRVIAQTNQQTRLVKYLLTSFDGNLREQSRRLMTNLESQFDKRFSIDLANTVKVRDIHTPRLYSGDRMLNLDTGDLERFTASMNAAATVFVRQGDGFVRVATTLKNEKGETALGTPLAAEHPAMKPLLAGEDYVGRAVLFTKDFMTAYRPVFDGRRQVIGALFVGLDVSDSVRRIKSEITSMKVGETGYYYALDARPGASFGTLTVHPNQEGSNILEAKDAAGNAFIKEILAKKQGTIRYPWINKEAGESSPRYKIATYDYLPEWDWVIAGGTYEDELARDSRLLRNVTFGATLAIVVVLGIVLWLLSRRLVARPLRQVIDVFDRIGSGHYDNPIAAGRADEVGLLFAALDSMQKNLAERTGAERRVAEEALRIKRALDKGSTNMMVANAEGTIIYMNEAVSQMMRVAESDIRKDLPRFRADDLIGRSFDEFHKNPAHQKNMLGALKDRHVTQIRIGGRTFRLVANPVVDERGQRLGSVVEWNDRTSEVRAETELASLLDAVVKGDFTRRLNLEDKAGFFRELAEGMNRLVTIVAGGLNDVARVLNAIAKGDLTQRIDADYQGTFGQLKDDANATVQRLKDVVGQIKESAEAINTAAAEIAAGNANLSGRTEEQASSLEETASSMEELSATVKRNAQNAQQANQLATSSNQAAVCGGEIVGRVVGTMASIEEASKRIADIIGVIDGIAFQTNILALNAAVEAARAGEQGKGFAVVASEVRNLAQRSAQAAKEIKSLIADSVEQVGGGVQLVQEAGQTMDEIVVSFQQVAGLVGEIAGASREQSAGIEQVSQAVTQMDEVTQQNAALVEEAAAAAESLEGQARHLVQAVSVFRLESGSGAPLSVSPPAAGNRPGSSPGRLERNARQASGRR